MTLQRLWAGALRAAALVAALACAPAGAQDFRDPVDQPFTVWPNIPVIRASDLGDYGQDRQIIADLHADKADPAKVAAALQAVLQLLRLILISGNSRRRD